MSHSYYAPAQAPATTCKATRYTVIMHDDLPRAKHGNRSYDLFTLKGSVEHYYYDLTPAAAREVISNPAKYGRVTFVMDDDGETYNMDDLPRSICPHSVPA